ncbi:MAG: branched-chain amino acid ABC transporter permease [Syntrophorhabdales bacterium]|jgi:branched-chain amino acid transport system permease protein
MKGRIFPAIIVLAVFLLPIIVPSPYVISVMCFIAIYGSLALGKAVLMENSGIFSVAHPAWFGIGAYVTAIATIKGVPPTLSIGLAALSVAFLAYIIGAPLLRLKEYYLANATFCLLIIVEIVIGNMGSLTGGHEGLMGIPSLKVGSVKLEGDRDFYFLSWGLCIGSLWFFHNLMRMRAGRALRTFMYSEAASKSMGINIPQYKLRIFVITSVMASLTGSILAFWLHFIQPAMFGIPLMIELITMVIVGGGEILYGPILGAFVIMWLREVIQAYLGKVLPVMTAEVDAVFFGIIVILTLIFMPGGLAGWTEQLAHAGRRVRGRFAR